jgi:hypothetical protein
MRCRLADAMMVVLARRLDHHESAIAAGAAVFVFIFRVVAMVRGGTLRRLGAAATERLDEQHVRLRVCPWTG